MNNNRINNPKCKLSQLFCRHDGEWCRLHTTFSILSGEIQYKVCCKCGKVLDKRFIPNSNE